MVDPIQTIFCGLAITQLPNEMYFKVKFVLHILLIIVFSFEYTRYNFVHRSYRLFTSDLSFVAIFEKYRRL